MLLPWEETGSNCYKSFKVCIRYFLNIGSSAYERKLITFTCSEAGSNCSNTELGIISPPYVTIVMVSSTGEWARINLINSHSGYVLSKPLIFTTLSLLKYKSSRHSALSKSRKENVQNGLTWNSQQNIVIQKSKLLTLKKLEITISAKKLKRRREPKTHWNYEFL